MDQDTLARLREELVREQEQQLEQLAEFGADPYGESVTGIGDREAGFADSAQAAEARTEALAHIDLSRARLRQVEEALARMDDGTYGVCVDCGNDIDLVRLEALPLSIRCVDDAAKAETA